MTQKFPIPEHPKQTTVTPLSGGGDPRCETLTQAILDLLHERAAGLPVPLVLGVLRIVEHQIIAENEC